MGKFRTLLMIQDAVNAYREYLTLVSQKASPDIILNAFNQYRLLCARREGPFGSCHLHRY